MKILLISNSARGEAIAEAFTRSKRKPELIVATTVRSPGFVRMGAEIHVLDMMDFPAILKLASEKKPNFAFIAPDDPIGAGLADELEKIGIPSVAPKKSLARIESSKGFARVLMKKHGIDMSPNFRSFGKKDSSDIRSFIERDLGGNYVVKYDALKGGKGVKVSDEHLASVDDGVKYAVECIEECGSVVIEEKLIGVEFSLMSFVSGLDCVDMPAVQDHKRAFEGDTGPNTGGMGTYSNVDHSLPFLTKKELQEASDCNKKVAAALKAECGESYKGILYGGFIATQSGVKVIEYNARFGDPEALNVLPILKTDFVDLCIAIHQEKLLSSHAKFEKKATVCKYIVPRSYPDAKNEKGEIVTVPDDIPSGAELFYGDVSLDDSNQIRLGGSRCIGVVGISGALEEAEIIAQKMCTKIQGPIRFRSDIGTSELLQKRIDFMSNLRKE